MIRIALVDDHKLFRQGLYALLSEIPGMDVVLQCDHGEAFLNRYEQAQVDVALLDLEMPVLNGYETLEKLQQHTDAPKAIIVSSTKEPSFIAGLMELGAKGYVLKEADAAELERAILSVYESGIYFSDLVSNAMLKRLATRTGIEPVFNGRTVFTEREKEVLQLICEEYTTQEIADKLFLSHRTVENHRMRIMDKSGVRNAAGLVVFAIKNNLVDVG